MTLPVTVHLDPAGDVPASVRLYGPGDVTGVNAAQIVRRDPAPGTTRFEAGYMPQVQFARADLPWLFTPAAPGTRRTRLRPWLVLVAVRRGGRRPACSPAAPLPGAELDDPAGRAARPRAVVGVGARADHRARRRRAARRRPRRRPGPGLLPARLRRASSSPTPPTWPAWCPRSLVGVQAGLGAAGADDATLRPGVGRDAAGPLRLPVYDSWEFATGPAGSFETLVRRLHPSPLDPDARRGRRTLDLSARRRRAAGRRR